QMSSKQQQQAMQQSTPSSQPVPSQTQTPGSVRTQGAQQARTSQQANLIATSPTLQMSTPANKGISISQNGQSLTSTNPSPTVVTTSYMAHRQKLLVESEKVTDPQKKSQILNSIRTLDLQYETWKNAQNAHGNQQSLLQRTASGGGVRQGGI